MFTDDNMISYDTRIWKECITPVQLVTSIADANASRYAELGPCYWKGRSRGNTLCFLDLSVFVSPWNMVAHCIEAAVE